jgi:hypothetical protein
VLSDTIILFLFNQRIPQPRLADLQSRPDIYADTFSLVSEKLWGTWSLWSEERFQTTAKPLSRAMPLLADTAIKMGLFQYGTDRAPKARKVMEKNHPLIVYKRLIPPTLLKWPLKRLGASLDPFTRPSSSSTLFPQKSCLLILVIRIELISAWMNYCAGCRTLPCSFSSCKSNRSWPQTSRTSADQRVYLLVLPDCFDVKHRQFSGRYRVLIEYN